MSEGFTRSAADSWSPRNSRRLTYGLIAALILISLGLYLFVFRPVTQQAHQLEASLMHTYGQIAATGFGQPETPGAYLMAAQSKLKKMQQLANELSQGAEFGSGLEDLLSSPFRVLEFEQRRFDIQQSLANLAEARGSSLPADFLSGLPSYRTTIVDQQLLWVHLEFFNHVMEALLSSGRDLRIERAESLPIRTLDDDSEVEGSLLLVRLDLKVEGPATALATFLNASLPEKGVANSSIGKKAYSIGRLNIEGDADRGDGRATLDTQLVGFMLSD